MFEPLRTYHDHFGASYGCPTTPQKPWWEDELDFADGSQCHSRLRWEHRWCHCRPKPYRAHCTGCVHSSRRRRKAPMPREGTWCESQSCRLSISWRPETFSTFTRRIVGNLVVCSHCCQPRKTGPQNHSPQVQFYSIAIIPVSITATTTPGGFLLTFLIEIDSQPRLTPTKLSCASRFRCRLAVIRSE